MGQIVTLCSFFSQTYLRNSLLLPLLLFLLLFWQLCFRGGTKVGIQNFFNMPDDLNFGHIFDVSLARSLTVILYGNSSVVVHAFMKLNVNRLCIKLYTQFIIIMDYGFLENILVFHGSLRNGPQHTWHWIRISLGDFWKCQHGLY